MSKAFTSEETEDEPLFVRPRAPLPDGAPNYVTPRGLDALRAELDSWMRERANAGGRDDDRRREVAMLGAQIAELEARIASAVVVEPQAPSDVVRFGARVRVRDEDDVERVYEIVGVDEADPKNGKIAFVAPLAQALLGKRVGDVIGVHAPGGEQELEIVATQAGDPSP